MAEARNVTIKLTADTTEYIAAIQHAKKVTQELVDLLESCGVSKADVPAAVLGVLKLAS